MIITLEKPSPAEGKFTIKVTPDEYNPSLNKALNDKQKKVSLKGFRQGHIPPALLKKQYGKEIVYQLTCQSSIKAIADYAKAHNLVLWGEPLLLSNDIFTITQPSYQETIQLEWCCAFIPPIDWNKLTDIQQTTYTIKGISEPTRSNWINELLNRHGHIEAVPVSEKETDTLYGILTGPKNFNREFLLPAHTQLGPNNPSLLGLKLHDTLSLTLSPEIPYTVGDSYIRENDAALYDQTIALLKTLEGTYSYTVKTIYRPIPASLDVATLSRIFPNQAITTLEEFKENLTDAIIQHVQAIANDLVAHEMKKAVVEKLDIPKPTYFIEQLVAAIYSHQPASWLAERQRLEEAKFCWETVINKIQQENPIVITNAALTDYLKKQLIKTSQPNTDKVITQEQVQIARNQLVQEKVIAILKDKFSTRTVEKTVEEFDAILQEKNKASQNL